MDFRTPVVLEHIFGLEGAARAEDAAECEVGENEKKEATNVTWLRSAGVAEKGHVGGGSARCARLALSSRSLTVTGSW